MSNSSNAYIPKPLPLSTSFVAPYWADVDLTGTGQVYYRQTKDPFLLCRATNEIQRVFTSSKNLTAINVLIVTWDAVGYFYNHTDKVCVT